LIESRQAIAPEDVAAHYDELDTFYRDVWGDHVHHGLWITGKEDRQTATRQLVDLIASQARLNEGDAVCDIGCGYGATARLLAREWKVRVTGITISPTQHAYATTRSRDPGAAVDFVLGDWLHCEVPPESFDAAIACESSEHMADKAAFFRQAMAALKPGGRLVVCAWLARENASALGKRWLLEPICREGRMPSLGTEREYIALGRAAGFHCESVRDISRGVSKTWRSVVGRYVRKLIVSPRYVRFLLNKHAKNRVFGLTILRLLVAFPLGTIRYGVFNFVKPS
jgi:tocopherol O-methyltransferase